MWFLTVLNYIAMGIGYIGLLFILIFVVWSIIETIKEKNQKKKWERERADKEKAESIVANAINLPEKEKSKSVEKDANQNKESLVDESGKIKVVN